MVLFLSRSSALQSHPSLAPHKALPTQDRAADWEMAPVCSRSCREHTGGCNPQEARVGRASDCSWLAFSVLHRGCCRADRSRMLEETFSGCPPRTRRPPAPRRVPSCGFPALPKPLPSPSTNAHQSLRHSKPEAPCSSSQDLTQYVSRVLRAPRVPDTAAPPSCHPRPINRDMLVAIVSIPSVIYCHHHNILVGAVNLQT